MTEFFNIQIFSKNGIQGVLRKIERSKPTKKKKKIKLKKKRKKEKNYKLYTWNIPE